MSLNCKFVKNIIFFYSFLLSTMFLFSQNPEIELSDANDYYQNKQFTKAIEIYQSLVDNGYESDALFYNLGNAYHHTGKFGKAISNYHRSLQIQPKNHDAIFNLRHTRLKTRDYVEIPRPSVVIRGFESIRTVMSQKEWLFWVQFLFALTIFLFWVKKLTYGRFLFLRIIFQVNLIVFQVFTVFWISNLVFYNINHNGTIVEQAVEIFSEPSEFGTHIATVHDGLEVELLKTQSGWQEIRLNDGTIGWIPLNSIGQFR